MCYNYLVHFQFSRSAFPPLQVSECWPRKTMPKSRWVLPTGCEGGEETPQFTQLFDNILNHHSCLQSSTEKQANPLVCHWPIWKTNLGESGHRNEKAGGRTSVRKWLTQVPWPLGSWKDTTFLAQLRVHLEETLTNEGTSSKPGLLVQDEKGSASHGIKFP